MLHPHLNKFTIEIPQTLLHFVLYPFGLCKLGLNFTDLVWGEWHTRVEMLELAAAGVGPPLVFQDEHIVTDTSA